MQVLILPVLIFFAWNPQLFRGESKIPKRTTVLFIAAAALNATWFVVGWKYGLQYQGLRYTHVVSVVNAGWISIIGLMFLYVRRSGATYWKTLAIHWMLFAWLGWYAFPYLGELP